MVVSANTFFDGSFALPSPPKTGASISINEECVYVLEGVLRYTVDDETRDLKPGEWMSTPRGSVHQFSNPGSETARTLVMLTPDIGEQFFRDVGALAGSGGPPDRTKLMEVMTRYGLVPAAPKQAPRVANGQTAS
jgi:Cupin domain